jgi:hypothetical protein
VGSNQAQPEGKSEQRWLDLQQIATVEVTSENASFPIESAALREKPKSLRI